MDVWPDLPTSRDVAHLMCDLGQGSGAGDVRTAARTRGIHVTDSALATMLSPGPSAAPPMATPAPLPGLPSIPSGDDHQAVAVQLLAIVAGDKARAEIRAELARIDQMTRISLERIATAPGSDQVGRGAATLPLHSVLRTQVVSLVRLERSRRRLQARLAALSGGPADPTDPEPTVAQAVAQALGSVRDVAEAAERIRQHEAGKLDGVEDRLKSLLDTARHARSTIGGFVQDTLLAEIAAALADRSQALRCGGADPADCLATIVDVLSPAD
jgi:hypothetical protein